MADEINIQPPFKRKDMIQQIVFSKRDNTQVCDDLVFFQNCLPVVPINEIERNNKLSGFNIDYSEMQEPLKDLAKLAAKAAGTSVSLINLIDSFTQWTVCNYGLPIEQIGREESVCQYTILTNESLEVKSLLADERFTQCHYITEETGLDYYYGVPLQTDDGFNIGTLCVLDKTGKNITPEKSELLKIIAHEIVNKLRINLEVQKLKNKVTEAKESQRRVAHDIRGPLGGIINLAQVISIQGDSNKMKEVLEFIDLIQTSGRSLLELTDEILSIERQITPRSSETAAVHELTLDIFKDKLEKLFTPQAYHKNIDFTVNCKDHNGTIPFPKNKLLQIAGNLISNALKFTPEHGKVTVDLYLTITKDGKQLHILVNDSGVGLDEQSIQYIKDGTVTSSQGTHGEAGYGFGLSLVRHLLDGLNGSMNIASKPGVGTLFEISIPRMGIKQ